MLPHHENILIIVKTLLNNAYRQSMRRCSWYTSLSPREAKIPSHLGMETPRTLTSRLEHREGLAMSRVPLSSNI